jgi:organic radical activating enzyme
MYDLSDLVHGLGTENFNVHVETSGAYQLTTTVDWLCVSPKKFKQPLPEMLSRADELKVVIFHPSDFEWAEQNALLTGNECRLFLQPEYDKSNKILPLIVEYVKQNPKWSISLQTHKYIGIP